MSHSKKTKRGKSLYVESWNPSAKKFINTCKICGEEGYSPTIEEQGFTSEGGKYDGVHGAVFAELTAILPPLPLDELGRCAICAKLMDKKG